MLKAISFLATLAALTSVADGFFILVSDTLVTERLDPIISFGQISTHVSRIGNFTGIGNPARFLTQFGPFPGA